MANLHLDAAQALDELQQLLTRAAATQPLQAADAEAITAALHAMADRYSEAEYQGVSDALVLLAELIDPLQHDPIAQQPQLLARTQNGLEQLIQAPHGASASLLECLIDPEWPQPLPADDHDFLSQVLCADLQLLSTLQSPPQQPGTPACADKPSPLPPAAQAEESEDATAVGSTVDPLQQQMVALLQGQLQQPPQDDMGCEHLTRALHRLSEQASDREWMGLADLFALYAELLQQLGVEGFALRQPVAAELAQAIGTLLHQASATALDSTMASMADPRWPEPVAADELAFSRELLRQDLAALQPLAESRAAAPNAEEPAWNPPPQPSSGSPEPRDQAESSAATLSTLETLGEAACTEAPAIEPQSIQEQSNEAQLNEAPFNEAPSIDARPLAAACLAPTVATDEPIAPDPTAAFGPADLAALTIEVEPIAEELVTMLAARLSEIHNQAQPASDAIIDTEALAALARASATAGMVGLHYVLEGLRHNLDAAPDQTALRHTLQALQHYLSAPDDRLARAAVVDACAQLPQPPDHAQSAYLSGLLAQLQQATTEPTALSEATAEEVALQRERDMDPELLAMLANELPLLAEQFAAGLQAATAHQQPEALRDAQRTAHTLKGLANMAGIRGLANLTHCLEDILERLSDAAQLPSPALATDLLTSADCLALMCEAINGAGEPPEDALACLQTLQRWDHRARCDGISALTDSAAKNADTAAEQPDPLSSPAPPLAEPSAETEPPIAPMPTAAVPAAIAPTAAAPAASAAAATATDPAAATQPTLAVAVSLLDELFRIAGESTTLTAQQDAVLNSLRKQSREHRERFRALERQLSELELQLLANPVPGVHTDDDQPFDHLEMDRYHALHTSLARLHEAAADVSQVNNDMESQIRHLYDLQGNQSSLQKESLDTVLRTRMVPVASLSGRLQRILRQACRSADKQAELELLGEQVEIDSRILAELADPLMHLIRNAVDHGIEPASVRRAAGKPAQGKIRLQISRDPNQIRVCCSDDGGGIDLQRVREIAIRKGLVAADAQLTDAETQALILLPGFSTRDQASQLSGRGIGMDVVKQRINRLHGNLEISSDPQRGTQIELRLPSSALMIRALLVRVAGQVVALSTQGLEQSLLSIDGTLERQEGQLYFNTETERLPAYRLETLLGHPEPRAAARSNPIHPVLMLRLASQRVAVLVSEILAHRELIFREMGSLVPPLPGITGITILANGEVAPVIDLAARIRRQRQGQIQLAPLPEAVETQLPRVMVVDDSISARKSLLTLLRDMGYRVDSAIDGLDALNKMRLNPPDLILTDFEMPRMNGVELAASVRGRETLQQIPLVMISSRSSSKHRQEAERAGIDRYLTKPWSEAELLDTLTELLHSTQATAANSPTREEASVS